MERLGVRHNAELVDELFEIMFGAVWTSPANRIRNAEAFRCFEQHTRRLVVLLTTTDLAVADNMRLSLMLEVSKDLAACIGELSEDRLIVRAQAEKATALVLRIQNSVEEVFIAVAETPSR